MYRGAVIRVWCASLVSDVIYQWKVKLYNQRIVAIEKSDWYLIGQNHVFVSVLIEIFDYKSVQYNKSPSSHR